MDGKSQDTIQQRIESLKQLFPDEFSEGKIDFQRLRQALGDDLTANELSWAGRAETRREIQRQTTSTLIPDYNQLVRLK